eukprot:scaffold421_cov125-Isochrysis_galbana.AAC.10
MVVILVPSGNRAGAGFDMAADVTGEFAPMGPAARINGPATARHGRRGEMLGGGGPLRSLFREVSVFARVPTAMTAASVTPTACIASSAVIAGAVLATTQLHDTTVPKSCIASSLIGPC